MLSVFFPPVYINEDSGLSRSVSMATGLNHIDTRPKVRTIFPHKSGNNTTLLSFEEGDIISLLIPDERDGWLYGELQKNKQWVELVNVCHLWAFHTRAGSRRHVYSLQLIMTIVIRNATIPFCLIQLSIKVARQTYLSSADAARSPIAVFDLEISC